MADKKFTLKSFTKCPNILVITLLNINCFVKELTLTEDETL